jgi:hypothetical protein
MFILFTVGIFHCCQYYFWDKLKLSLTSYFYSLDLYLINTSLGIMAHTSERQHPQSIGVWIFPNNVRFEVFTVVVMKMILFISKQYFCFKHCSLWFISSEDVLCVSSCLMNVSWNVHHNSSRNVELYKLNVNVGVTIMKRLWSHGYTLHVE